jgi:hypothetical protein
MIRRIHSFSLPAILVVALFCFCGVAASQDSQNPPPATAPNASPSTQAANSTHSRLTIQVSGGDKDEPVENASVYVKFNVDRKLRKDEKVALNVKTNREGVAHVPDPPVGSVLVQIVADGWKTYGKSFDITDPNQIIKIHLDKPPKWY